MSRRPIIHDNQDGWLASNSSHDERSHMFLLCFFSLVEEPDTTVALVSTFTGAPSTSGSPANLSSKTSYISMESLMEEGTLYTI